MQKFTHLNPEQRYQIEVLNKDGYTQTKIVAIVAAYKRTIRRELKRNTGKRDRHSKAYSADVAIHRTQERHRLKRKNIRFTEPLKAQARIWLEQDKLSPELISAQWARLGQ
ncbi:hypothetical protein [Algoriphagus sp.]|uniref:hypothetical protein n=1 Tax=Algoriphagus sp. TaxID=1872435 RepID=UPI003F72762B